MPGNVELRHHGYTALGGIGDDLFEFLLRVIPADLTTESFGPLQARIFFRLQPPAVIIGQVPMENIHLVKCHHVENRLDAIHFKIIAPAVIHETAIAHGGPIDNPAVRNLAAAELQKLGERDAGITFAARIGGNDFNSVRRNFQHVRLGGDGGRSVRHAPLPRRNFRADRGISLARARFRLHRLGQQEFKGRCGIRPGNETNTDDRNYGNYSRHF